MPWCLSLMKFAVSCPVTASRCAQQAASGGEPGKLPRQRSFQWTWKIIRHSSCTSAPTGAWPSRALPRGMDFECAAQGWVLLSLPFLMLGKILRPVPFQHPCCTIQPTPCKGCLPPAFCCSPSDCSSSSLTLACRQQGQARQCRIQRQQYQLPE